MREQIFHKQMVCMSVPGLKQNTLAAIIEANHSTSLYDQLYSHDKAPNHENNFDSILARISNSRCGTPASTASANENSSAIGNSVTNGLWRTSSNLAGRGKKRKKNHHFNGSMPKKLAGLLVIHSLSSIKTNNILK